MAHALEEIQSSRLRDVSPFSGQTRSRAMIAAGAAQDVWTTRTLVLEIAQTLVERKESVAIEIIPDDDEGVTLRLQVAAADLGNVIGKQGRIARSIRTILSGISRKSERRIVLEIQTL